MVLLFFLKVQSIPSINYFPYTEKIKFKNYDTLLELPEENKTKHLKWKITSETTDPAYLRQDVGLLFKDNQLIGVLNKWQQNDQIINQNSKIPWQQTSTYQAISFHFGEIHNGSQINSTFKTSTASFINHSHGHLDSSKKRKDPILFEHWQMLANYFSLELRKYQQLSLTELTEANLSRHLPSKNLKAIYGHLWEGIYKNYILRALELNNSQFPNYEPLVLIAKDHSEILVIYELNGEKELLIQKI